MSILCQDGDSTEDGVAGKKEMKKNGIGRCVLLALMLIGGFIVDDAVLTNSFLRWLFAVVFTALFVWVALPLVRAWRQRGQPRERSQHDRLR